MSSQSNSVFFHNKHEFTLCGFSMYDIFIEQEKFTHVNILHIKNPIEKWQHPLISNMKEKIEELYGMSVKNVIVKLYNNGEESDQYHCETDSSIFIISLGCSRILLVKNDDNVVSKYVLEDGDLFFFNSDFNKTHEYSIPKVKNLKMPHINVLFFV